MRIIFQLLPACLLFASVAWPWPAAATSEEICIYIEPDGKMTQVNSKAEVPVKFRDSARCFEQKKVESAEAAAMAKPKDIELEGNTRREDMSSSVGRIKLRWPRKIELLFGRTPMRATADASRTLARALRKPGFPLEIQNMNIEWDIVFMDQNLPEQQIPSYLVSNCHPGWMTPPGNIYIVGQRVAAGCSGRSDVRQSVADAQLAEVLIHEMGHAVEAQLLGGNMAGSRMRAEGFATWFQTYAARYSSLVSESQAKQKFIDVARKEVQKSPSSFQFKGSGEDYSRASMYFHAIEARRGVRGIAEVYNTMREEKIDFFAAVQKRYNWDRARLEQEVHRFLGMK